MAAASSPPPESSPQQLGTPVSKQLTAPAGWLKQIASTKSGGTPRRGAVYFIAPDGKEIKSKKSLEAYLKSNPGGPSITEFDWSTGETPRRSSRLGVMTPATSPERGADKRRVRRKVAVEDEAFVIGDDDAVCGTASGKTEVAMEDVEELKETDVDGTVVRATLAKTGEAMEDIEELKENDIDKAVGGATSADTEVAMKDIDALKEKDVMETVKLVEKVELIIDKKVVGKSEDYKINGCVPEVDTEEHKNVEGASPEAKTDEPQTVGSLSKAGMEEGKQTNAVVPEGNGPEEELVTLEEIVKEKVQMEEGKPDKLLLVMEETSVEVVSKEARHEGEATYTGDIGTLGAEDKKEGLKEKIIGLAELLEAPDIQRPNGTSV